MTSALCHWCNTVGYRSRDGVGGSAESFRDAHYSVLLPKKSLESFVPLDLFLLFAFRLVLNLYSQLLQSARGRTSRVWARRLESEPVERDEPRAVKLSPEVSPRKDERDGNAPHPTP